MHGRAHLVVEQVYPPADLIGSTRDDTVPFLAFVAVVLGGVLLAAALSNTALLVVWLLVVSVAVTAVVVEARLTRDATSTARLCGAAAAVTALGHHGVVVRVDNFASTRRGDGRELMVQWQCYIDGHGMAVVLNARTTDPARRYATYDGFHPVSSDDQLVMYRLPGHGRVTAGRAQRALPGDC